MFYTLTRGRKRYELSNHLGNVLTVVSDRKLQISENEETVECYGADIWSTQDYYPFGMVMPGREDVVSSDFYRFGFNGKEKDDEVSGNGNQYDYGFRVYNPRIAKFLSVDPLAPEYPWYSPYHFAGNTPIQASDLDGLEPDGRVLFYAPLSETALLLNLPQNLKSSDNRSRIVLINEETMSGFSGFISGGIDPSGRQATIINRTGLNDYIMSQLSNSNNFAMDGSSPRTGYADNILEKINRIISTSASNSEADILTVGAFTNTDRSAGRILVGNNFGPLFRTAEGIGGVPITKKIKKLTPSGKGLSDFSSISSLDRPLVTDSRRLEDRLLTPGLFRTNASGNTISFTENDIKSNVFAWTPSIGASIIADMTDKGSLFIYSNSELTKNPLFIIDRYEADFLTPLLDSKANRPHFEGTIQFKRNPNGGATIDGETTKPR